MKFLLLSDLHFHRDDNEDKATIDSIISIYYLLLTIWIEILHYVQNDNYFNSQYSPFCTRAVGRYYKYPGHQKVLFHASGVAYNLNISS